MPEILKTARWDTWRSRIPGAVGQSVAVFTFHERWKWKREREGGGRENENRRERCGESVGAKEGESVNKALHCWLLHLLFTSPLGVMEFAKKRVDFSRVIFIVSSCGVCREKLSEGNKLRGVLGKGGGELGEMKDRTRQESRKYFFMIWNENISLDQSVIARGGGGGRETCKGYFRLTDWLIGLLWGRHADMLFRATVIAIAFLLLIIYSIIPRSTASQKPKVISSDPTLRVWSWFGFLV